MRAPFLSIPVLILALGGCRLPETPPPASLREANDRFEAICREEFHQPVRIRTFDRTVRMYFPLTFPIIELKAAQGPPGGGARSVPQVLYLKTSFEEGVFTVVYDIRTQTLYPREDGLSNGYSAAFTRLYRRVLYDAVRRAYFDLGEVPGDITFHDEHRRETHDRLVSAHIRRSTPPEFLVLVFADISTGILQKNILAFTDLKQALAPLPSLPQDEFRKRRITETRGDPDLIGDMEGTHLETGPVTRPDFLAAQIAQRIRTRYTQSESPPDRPTTEILRAVRDTVTAYGFQDFQGVRLLDRARGGDLTYDRSILQEIPESPAPRTIRIPFSLRK